MERLSLHKLLKELAVVAKQSKALCNVWTEITRSEWADTYIYYNLLCSLLLK